jgi:hypothetical protein
MCSLTFLYLLECGHARLKSFPEPKYSSLLCQIIKKEKLQAVLNWLLRISYFISA